MALCNFRNISIFYVCALPFLSIYLPFQDGKEEKIPVKLYILFIAMIVLTISMNTYNGSYILKIPIKSILIILIKMLINR